MSALCNCARTEASPTTYVIVVINNIVSFCANETFCMQNSLSLCCPLQTVPQEDIRSQLTLSRCKISDRDRRFMQYARQWWKEYASHSRRPLKIFAQDECGTSRPVFSYIQPLKAGRLLDTPRQAARFVSLLGMEEEASMWGAKTEMWTTLHAFLCRGKGVSRMDSIIAVNI